MGTGAQMESKAPILGLVSIAMLLLLRTCSSKPSSCEMKSCCTANAALEQCPVAVLGETATDKVQAAWLVDAVNKGGSGCTSWSKCAAGEGDCDSDSDCYSGLKCYQRSGGEVPGIKSMAGMPDSHDFCYDPSNADA